MEVSPIRIVDTVTDTVLGSAGVDFIKVMDGEVGSTHKLRVNHTGSAQVVIGDGANLDAFSRLRVSDPYTQFDSTAEYGLDTLKWDTAVVGSGAVSAVANQCALRLTTGGTTDTHAATLQSKPHMIYQPGKSRLVLMTFVMSAAQSNGLVEIGYGNTNNGIFLQRSGSAIQLVRRTNVTGTPVDNVVAQTDWNLDPLNGLGESGYTLNLTRANIFIIDLQFLGVGRVRVGFDLDGKVIYCHEFRNANSLSTVYMSTGSLPLRYRVLNSGTAGGTTTLDAICQSVVSEGGV